MKLFDQLPQRRESADYLGRLAALEDYVEYLRQQGQYGFSQAGKRLDALEGQRESERG